MRWGELAGLRRPNCKLREARIHVDRDHGALHEVGGHLSLGPPKTPAAVRDILLPPFLVNLLSERGCRLGRAARCGGGSWSGVAARRRGR
jgi:hypothetical protein